MKQEGP
jgi:hypothetical protein